MPFRKLLNRLARAAAASMLALGLLAPLAAAPVAAEEGFVFEDQAAFEAAVRAYLMERPEVIMEALEVLEQRQEAEREARRVAALEAGAAELFDNPATPVVGNPDGDVTLVEFFDYRCGYCRGMAEELMELVDSDGNIRVVMMEFPILGPESLFAARAALAARQQDAYDAMHRALMIKPGQVTPASVLATAEELGLDVAKLQADMKSSEVDEVIRTSHRLAGELDINGTPAFVIGRRIIPGAVGVETLKGLIEEQRAKSG